MTYLLRQTTLLSNDQFCVESCNVSTVQAAPEQVAKVLQAMDIGWAWWVWRGGGTGWSHGSSEFVYKYTNGTLEFDDKAFDAVRPFL